jgi:NAD(P)-dependent dehydrogenase (short-subunit alcohol dehydrogenase family)
MELSGKVAIVTGANTGLGFETALDLYSKGAKVYVGCRVEEKGKDAIARMKAAYAIGGELELGLFDLASMQSVKAFAEKFIAKENRLDLLINNAGVMIPPASKSEDGFELQFGVNFIGHFTLTGQLFNLLEATPNARIVTLSSIAHRGGVVDFENLRLEKPYSPWREYSQSKVADLMFTQELDKRLKENHWKTISLAAHPGFSKTDLQKNMDKVMLDSLELMTAKQGAQSTLVASLHPDAQGGQYWGPDGHNEQKGNPALAMIDAAATNEELNAKLWDWAKEATDAGFPF